LQEGRCEFFLLFLFLLLLLLFTSLTPKTHENAYQHPGNHVVAFLLAIVGRMRMTGNPALLGLTEIPTFHLHHFMAAKQLKPFSREDVKKARSAVAQSACVCLTLRP
jgi:hypothetical protein